MIAPLAGKYFVTSTFGWRINPLRAGESKMHTGVDLDQHDGADILAPFTGTVVDSSYSRCGGNGITIRSLDGVAETSVFHLAKRQATTGSIVTEGQVIGTLGNTGTCTTGSHVHWDVIVLHDGRYSYVDPIAMMNGRMVYDPRGMIATRRGTKATPAIPASASMASTKTKSSSSSSSIEGSNVSPLPFLLLILLGVASFSASGRSRKGKSS